MIVVRSWPKDVPAFRACVDDNYPRMYVDNYDHAGLVHYDDDVLLLEWDIAIAPEDVTRFQTFVAADTERVAAVPYRLYPVSTGLPGTVWSHRIVISANPWMVRWGVGEPFADIVSLGATYLPRTYLRQYVNENPNKPLNDTNFGMWYYFNHGRKIPIDWRIRPVHLHYC